jgi:hypothetical protein
MTGFELLSITIAIVALILSAATVVYTHIQTKRAKEAVVFQQQIARGDAVMHFTDRFFDLLRTGEPLRQISDPDWAYQFWSLQASEFYFFHHGLLPPFMYSLWMIDLAELYSGIDGQKVRETHVKYLKEYSLHYHEMTSFYSELYKLAKDYSDNATRNRKVAEFVTIWITQNRRVALS